jgi:hypothetical protein
MRRLAFAFALAAATALPAAAQMPPSIRKPIDAAKKAAGNTNKQVDATNKVGAQIDAPLPAAAAQAAQAAPGAKGAQATGKAAAAPAAATKAAPDSVQKRGSASQAATKGTVTFYREEYSYSDEGRRDPFVSLMATGELRPLLADLVITGVLYDYAAPNRSLAVLVDGSTQEIYRVKVGMTLGRMKVTKIGEKDVTFSIDEFGFSRQETLLLDTSSKTAGGAPGRRPQ